MRRVDLYDMVSLRSGSLKDVVLGSFVTATAGEILKGVGAEAHGLQLTRAGRGWWGRVDDFTPYAGRHHDVRTHAVGAGKFAGRFGRQFLGGRAR